MYENEISEGEMHADMLNMLLWEKQNSQDMLKSGYLLSITVIFIEHMGMDSNSFDALCVIIYFHCCLTCLLRLNSLCCNNTIHSLQLVLFPLLLECVVK